MDAKNLFLDPDKQEKSAEKLSRDRKSAIGFRDATSGRKRRTYWIEAQKHAWTNSVVSPKKSPPRKSTKLNWFLCSHAIRRGGQANIWWKATGQGAPENIPPSQWGRNVAMHVSMWCYATMSRDTGLQIRIWVELELRTSPNLRTSFFVELANFTELSGKWKHFLGKCCILGKSRKNLAWI